MVDATVGAMIAATVSATTALPVADRQPMMHETLCISLSVRLCPFYCASVYTAMTAVYSKMAAASK